MQVGTPQEHDVTFRSGVVSAFCDQVTKASEASWSYSCDSKVSFDRVQILTPDFSGRRPPPLPPPLSLACG